MSDEIWVFLEIERDELKKISLELLSHAGKLAAGSGTSVSAVLIGQGIKSLSGSPFDYGADKVYLAGREEISSHDTDTHVNMMQAMIKEYRPFLLLLGATPLGREIAPRLAARLDAPLISDCMDIKLENGQLVGQRPVLNGKAHATVACPESPFCIATAGAGAFEIQERKNKTQGEIVAVADLSPEKSNVEFLEYVKGDPATINLKEAEIIIALGRGLGSADNMKMIEELAGLLGASIGGTRVAVDLKWMTIERQIGITGVSVSPRLFISCGISGQYPHTVGMDASETIIVINRDREAPMFKLASLGIVGTLEEIVPALCRRIRTVVVSKEQS